MLRLLRVSNLAVIESVEVEFHEGLNVLTGETGAGKSLLMGALNLLLGARASSDLIRTGADEALVEALFDLPEGRRPPDWPQAVDITEGEVLLTRRLHKSGRSKCFVNGRLATVGALQALSRAMVTIFGQHEQQVLLNPGEHCDILDQFGGLSALKDRVSHAHSQWKVAHKALERARTRLADIETTQRESLESAKELSKAALKPDEEEDLVRERELLKKSSQIREKAYELYGIFYSRSGSVVETCKEARKSLDFLASIHPDFETYRDEVADIAYRLEDVALSLSEKAQKAVGDPIRLEIIEERLAFIRKLKRKYGTDVTGLLRMLHAFGEEEGELLEARSSVRGTEAAAAEAHAAFSVVAAELGAERKKAAQRIEEALKSELADLAMPDAVFMVRFQDVGPEAGANGLEKVEFLLAANKGDAPKPLARTASGGELSRIMLALKALQADSGTAGAIVFDEVDAGIGGRTAVAVADRLARVARGRQVLCITHLHQIAARADHHVSVSKISKDMRVAIELAALQGEDRIRELARMLGAAPDSETARNHARRLIESAGQEGTA